MNALRILKTFVLIVIILTSGCTSTPPVQFAPPPTDDSQSGISTPTNPAPWPRKFSIEGSSGNVSLQVYQPQVEKWEGNQVDFRAAVGAQSGDAATEIFGVIWATARTEVDRAVRMVTLEDLKLTRCNFPTLSDNGASYLKQLQRQFTGTSRMIALDRLQASLAASSTVNSPGVAVKNEPPQIFISYSPAILIPISGDPVWRDVPDSRFERVINTPALILREKLENACYLHVYDGWLSAASVDGSWSQISDLPWHIDDVADKLAEKKLVDLLTGGDARPLPSLANGIPTIYVSQKPAELIVFKGQPNLQPIDQTTLLWASNTTADVIVDTADNFYYILISGRWYSAVSLNGPWRFVDSKNLPPVFRSIPASAPAGVVLACVAGTPQAKEAVIANSIPQTAVIPRTGGPSLTPLFDGAPQLRPISGTPLQYVANSPTPIIRVDSYTYYALSSGVWFTATSTSGPWVVAASVPAVIYTIPPSSALYYVTFVHVYGSTPEVVYVGYTPGYLGTVVEPDGTVVYGTGYTYEPWVGTVYYPPPVTYGVQAQPVYNPAVDMAYGMALGMTTAAMVDSWNQPVYYTSFYHGYPCCGSTSASVYGHYGNTSWSGTNTYYSHSDGDVGQKASGSYTNYKTGSTGTYSANRYENPEDGTAGRSSQRTVNTADGGTGDVSRNETYNAKTGQTSYNADASGTGRRGNTGDVTRSGSYDAQTGQSNYSSDKTASGQGGSSVTRDSSASWGAEGPSADRQTSVYNANTGQTKTYGSGSDGADHYASADGTNYRNDGSGWQKQTSNGWQSAKSEDTSWADREQQARSQANSSFSQSSAMADRSGNGGFSGDRSGGLGGGGNGWASHFNSGGFGDRFGEGGGGGFGGRGGRR